MMAIGFILLIAGVFGIGIFKPSTNSKIWNWRDIPTTGFMAIGVILVVASAIKYIWIHMP